MIKSRHVISTGKGALIYDDRHGPGVIIDVLSRKNRSRMLSVLFGGDKLYNVYETEVCFIQTIERSIDDSVCITFKRKHQLSPTDPNSV
jgi:hypothetical protein